MNIEIIDKAGKKIDKLKVENVVQSENMNHIFYLVNNYQNHQMRQKSANTKTRAEVRGGGAKPYKQKGTGRARRGTSRTPLRVGGGVVFGPKPIKRVMKLNKSVVTSAIRGSLLLSPEKVTVIKSAGMNFVNAKELIKSSLDKKVLIISSNDNLELINSFRNFNNCTISTPTGLLVREILGADVIYVDYNVKDLFEGEL